MADLYLLGGAPIIEATITLPRVGLWTAVAVVDAPDVVTPAIALPGLDLVGTVKRVGAYQDATRVELVGAGALTTKALPAKAYRGVPLRIPLTDALDAAGVTLAPSSSPQALTHHLAQWVRAAGPARGEVAQLARAVGMTWRALPDGSLWLGRETWPETALLHELLSESPEADRVEIWSESLSLRPGMTFMGRHVSTVTHTIRPSRIRTTVWFEP